MRDEPKNEDVLSSNPEMPVTPEAQPENQPVAEPVVEYTSDPVVDLAVEPVVEPAFQPMSAPLPQPSDTPIGSSPEVISSTPVAPQPNKKRKKLVLGAIIAGALLLLSGTGAAAYFLWYQNPEKVVTDALVHAITAETIKATGVATVVGNDGYTLKIEVSGRNDLDANAGVAVKLTATSEDLNVTVDGEGIFSKDGDIYVKVNDVQKLLDSFEDQSDGQVSFDSFGAVIKKVDGNWIKISKDDLGDVSEEYEATQKCFAEVTKSLESDASFRKTATNEIEKLYKENNFLTLGDELKSRTIDSQNSIGYPVSFDRTKADTFFTGFASTELGKKISDCDDSIKFSDIADDYNTDETSSPEVELWVSRFGHTITELNWKMSDEEASGTIVVNPVFNKNEAVAVPTDFVSLSEVLAELEAAYEDTFMPSENEEDLIVNYN